MAQYYDLVIRGGTIADGTGAALFEGDVAVKDGVIAAIGTVTGSGAEEIAAKGLLVTPGFIDVHTHYDGQVTWEETLSPSSNHGVTTAVMGNCGVGFAPCRPGDRDTLIRFMEGVEDIPEVVMADGIPWNWESLPDYMDALDARRFDMDIAVQLPHSALRVFVMGDRGAAREPATEAELAEMRRLTAEAVSAGALGVSTSRMHFHRALNGDKAPSVEAADEELLALAGGLADAGRGVFQMITDLDNTPEQEFGLMRRITGVSGRPLSFTLVIPSGT